MYTKEFVEDFNKNIVGILIDKLIINMGIYRINPAKLYIGVITGDGFIISLGITTIEKFPWHPEVAPKKKDILRLLRKTSMIENKQKKPKS
jgi:hypothetical protein